MMLARPWRRFRSVNSSSADFPALAAQRDLALGDAGTAAGRAVLDLCAGSGGNGPVPTLLQLMPFGNGADNDAFSLKVVGWRRVVPVEAASRQLWVPLELAVVACTLSTQVGLAGAAVTDADRFADTIAITREATVTADTTREGTVWLWSPGSNLGAAVVSVPVAGFEAVELQFDQTTGTPTMNALYALLSKC